MAIGMQQLVIIITNKLFYKEKQKEDLKTRIKTYYIKFSVDTLHTEDIVKAYSKTDAETLLNKQYSNSKVCISNIRELKR